MEKLASLILLKISLETGGGERVYVVDSTAPSLFLFFSHAPASA
jgi:hypothetical protein